MKQQQFFLLLASAAAAFSPQKVLQAPQDWTETWSNQISDLQNTLKSLTSEGRAIWDEVVSVFPDAFNHTTFFSAPKKHRRRPASHWDFITAGHGLQATSLEDAGEQGESQIDGHLSPYTLRTKAVDPSSLGVDEGVKQLAGYLDDDENDKHLFYWFFESRGNPKTDPVILWLSGGPGCSSLVGLFFELGPAGINKKLEVVSNPFSWNSNASVIFLDQPVNVGFSYSGSSVSNTVAAGKDVYALLTLFFKQFPEYASQDFHIAAESYGGHYAPVFATEILKHKRTNINLKSLLIGNGLTDALNQYPEYRPMACGQGGYPAVLDESSCQAMDNALPRCLSLIETCQSTDSVWTCVPATIYCNNAILGPYQRTGQNVYDVREPCGDNPLCYDGLDYIEQWLNKEAVMESLGVEVDSFQTCNFDINRNFLFQGDWLKPYHRLVPDILEKIPVLIYAGDADFICNWLGNQRWTDELEWYGSKAYAKVGRTDLELGGDGKKVGEVKSSGNLTFILVSAASHMVPYNQPEGSLDFVNRWLRGEWAERD